MEHWSQCKNQIQKIILTDGDSQTGHKQKLVEILYLRLHNCWTYLTGKSQFSI